MKTNIFDKPRAALHLGHLLSRLFLYCSSVHASHPTKVEQLEHKTIGRSAGICLHMQDWKAFSKGLMNDILRRRLKASYRDLLISASVSIISPANWSWDSLQLYLEGRWLFLEVLLISLEFSLTVMDLASEMVKNFHVLVLQNTNPKIDIRSFILLTK